MNLPVGEPKDGDFVAYVAEIERQQMARLPTNALTALNGAHKRAALTQAAAAAPREIRTLPANLVGNIVLGVVGLFFLLLGLVGDGGVIAAGIGAFLIWRAAKSVSAELGGTRHDVRERLAQTLNAAKQER
jgi:hypothetical protein